MTNQSEHKVEGLARKKLESELNDVYGPRPIRDPTRFSGRVEDLDSCRPELANPSMSFAIYGARGLGKSSFANVLLDETKFLRRTAQPKMGFDQLLWPILKALNEGLVIERRETTDGTTDRYGLDAKVITAGSELTHEDVASYRPPVDEVVDLDFVATALARRRDQIDAIVIEEFQYLPAETQRDVVRLMKLLSDRGAEVRIVVVGITNLGEQLMKDPEFKEYVGRCIVIVPLPRMTRDELRDIIDRRVADGVAIEGDVADDLAWVASGYPALVHRVMFLAVARWIATNTVQLIRAAYGLVTSAIRHIRALAGLAENRVVKKVEFEKAGIYVTRADVEAALKAVVSSFEESERVRYDPDSLNAGAKASLDAYALADDNDLEPEARAALFTVEVGTPRPSLRPYLRAKLLLGGDPRAGAHGSS